MAGLFGLFAPERRPQYSLPKLQQLHERLQSILEADEQTDVAVEIIREMTEALLWGEQNDHNENFFDFFCEKSILADFVRLLGRPVAKTVKVQLLQSLSMLIQNIRRPTSLYYLFSNNYVNQLIATQFDWADEEILGYYISFLKSLALRLNEETIKFFFNERSQQFPLFTEAIRFFSHHDQMVRTSVRTLTLRVFGVRDVAMQSFVLKISRPYFRHLARHLTLLWRRLEASRAAHAEQQDLVMYICDVLLPEEENSENQEFKAMVARQFLHYACYPFLLGSLDHGPLSRRTALFLLVELFQLAPRQILEQLARALLDLEPPPRGAEILEAQELEVWEPFQAEDAQEEAMVTASVALRPLLLGPLLDEETLLVCGLLRSCLGGSSSVVPPAVLADAGLLPGPGLEVLSLATRKLEQHVELPMVSVNGLVRLCLDVASTPEARAARNTWSAASERVATAMRSAAEQVRTFIDHLGEGFLDIFADAWELEHEPPPLHELCGKMQCLGNSGLLGDWAMPGEADSQQAFKAIRVMLLLRRLHAELADAVSPRRPMLSGSFIDSALAPLNGPESPLQIPEEDFNTSEGGSFQLGRMDRIVCGVLTPEGKRLSRYMILHHYLLLLVQPDLVTPGYAVVKTLLPVRQVEPHLDNSDPRQLFLRSEEGDGLVLTLTFEDTKRCSIAEAHLKKCRKKVRERLHGKLRSFVEKICE